jgi:hypothetical protein
MRHWDIVIGNPDEVYNEIVGAETAEEALSKWIERRVFVYSADGASYVTAGKVMAEDEVTHEDGSRWKRCEACGGRGNVDEAAGCELDCLVCAGGGWIEIESAPEAEQMRKEGATT